MIEVYDEYAFNSIIKGLQRQDKSKIDLKL